MNTAEFIQRLPKAELHLHLEGAVPWAMIREYAPDPLPEIAPYGAADFRFDDFAHFSRAMWLGVHYVTNSLERYSSVAQQLFESLVAQNIRFAEISFGAELAMRDGMTVDSLVQTIRDAVPDGLKIAIVAGFNREVVYSLDDPLVQAVLNAPLDGIDLHATELPGTAIPYAEIYEAARQRGLMTRAHAGELLGAESVWDACNYLKVKRIEHGTRAIEDPALVEHLLNERITLDLCPTSNYKLRVVDTIEAHPIKTFFDQGLSVTVSSDDPTFFGCTLTDELHLLVDVLGFTLPELAELQKNAFRVAKISDEERAAIFAEIDELVQ